MSENQNRETTGFLEEEALKIRDARSTLLRFFRSIGRQKVRLLIVLLSVACYTAFNIAAPLYSARVVDLIWNRVQEMWNKGQSFHITWEYGGRQIFLLLLLYGTGALFYVLQNFLMASFAERLSLQLRSEVGEKLQRLPLSFFDGHQPGQVMSHITNDLDKMSEALQTGMIRFFVAVGTVIGSIVMMFRFSVTLTLVFLFFTGITLLLTRKLSHYTLQTAIRRQEAVGALNGLVEESYTGRAVIQAFQQEKESLKKVTDAANDLAKASRDADFLISAINPGIRMINRFGMVVITVLGGGMLLQGTMTPGVFQAFFQYINQAGEPITELSYMLNSMQSALASVERVYTLLDEEEISSDPADPALPSDPVRGSVCFSHVRFGYTPERILMQDVSFEARPGQKIAIVGSTGAGKTTLVNLLMRFYETDGGQILLDGQDTGSMTRADLRGAFGMVLQDAWLFEGTIAENIAYGRPDASREEIIAAAKAARADFFIRTLPHGYETVLSNDADNISIGQRQLLTIARVFLCDPKILILDEATSSVDTRTELEIGSAMQALMQGRTSFVIAHRLSTIVDADLILVMQHGTIIETGNHRELLNAGGAYARLYNSQFA